MFGDPSQVPRILTICILALTAVVLLIITGFIGFVSRRHNEENQLRLSRRSQHCVLRFQSLFRRSLFDMRGGF